MNGIDLAERLADDGTWSSTPIPPYIEKGTAAVHDFTPEDHSRLAAVLGKRNNRVPVSYDHPEVRRL